LDFVAETKKPVGVLAGGLVILLISLADQFRPWQSAGMEIP
jgi:hypothetical protein